MKKLVVFILLITTAQSVVQAQVDPHFSQYYIYPSWLNPALTGSFNGDYRVSAVYRNQWEAISGGFKTVGLAADAVTGKNLNIGANLFNQTTGTGYSYLSGNASFAYTGVRFGKDNMKVMAFGLQAGLINRKFDPTKFQTGEQWTSSGGYVPGAGSGEVLNVKSATAFDASVGVLYYDMTPLKKVAPYIGASVSHLTQPDDAFTASTTKSKLPMRYTVHGGVAINASDALLINPNFLYLRQGTTEEKMIGAYAQIRGGSNLDLLGGANYRFNDAIVPFVGVDYSNLLIGVSYDANQSDLGRTLQNANTFEVTMSYIFSKSKVLGQRNVTCPRL